MRPEQIDILFVIAPHSLLLDIAGAAEAFRLADQHRGWQGLPARFRLRFTGPEATIATSVGLGLAPLEPMPTEFTAPTWVVVVGQPSPPPEPPTPAVRAIARWLDRTLRGPLFAAGSPHRLMTVCSGALLAARGGLLTGRNCTTHHSLLEALRKLDPGAAVVDDRAFVVDGPVATSAGITAGIDLALHLVAEECGEALATSVAEDMVVYLRRSPGDPELSPFLAHRSHLHVAVHRVQDAITTAPERDWDMAALANVAHASERHLLRLFIDHAGVSPLDYLRTIRLERARQALEFGATVTRAAEVAGFSSDLQLRRAWARQWGGSPRDAAKARRPAARTPGRGRPARRSSGRR
ncbi:MAG TPA: helix-turn-helix domain-containing protein [Gemmatimonadales bacterium]|nr:helix-turn-helix domain-containing protein [Gemmatimonadales bacterium]